MKAPRKPGVPAESTKTLLSDAFAASNREAKHHHSAEDKTAFKGTHVYLSANAAAAFNRLHGHPRGCVKLRFARSGVVTMPSVAVKAKRTV